MNEGRLGRTLFKWRRIEDQRGCNTKFIFFRDPVRRFGLPQLVVALQPIQQANQTGELTPGSERLSREHIDKGALKFLNELTRLKTDRWFRLQTCVKGTLQDALSKLFIVIGKFLSISSVV
jgi:hypothetical protein